MYNFEYYIHIFCAFWRYDEDNIGHTRKSCKKDHEAFKEQDKDEGNYNCHGRVYPSEKIRRYYHDGREAPVL